MKMLNKWSVFSLALSLLVSTGTYAGPIYVPPATATSPNTILKGGTGASTADQAAINLGQGVINVKNRGLPTAGNDDAALRLILTEAHDTGKVLYFPAGTYKHKGTLTLDGVCLYGDGPTTIIRSTNVDVTDTATAIYNPTPASPQNMISLTGEKPCLKNVQVLSDWIGARRSNDPAVPVAINSANGAEIASVFINNSASVGIKQNNSTRSRIHDNYIYDTLADGIINTHGSSYSVIANNQLDTIGDDCISVVSYNSDAEGSTHDITAIGNTCKNGSARGFTVVGGYNVTHTGWKLENITGSALYVAAEGAPYYTNGVNNVTFSDGIINGSGSVSPALACIQAYGNASYTVSNITFSDITNQNCRTTGIQLGSGGGPYAKNIKVRNVYSVKDGVTASTSYGSYLAGCADCAIIDSHFEGFRQHGTVSQSAQNSGFVWLENNTYRANSSFSSGTYAAINLAGSGFTSGWILNNKEYNAVQDPTLLAVTGAASYNAQAMVVLNSADTNFKVKGNGGDNNTHVNVPPQTTTGSNYETGKTFFPSMAITGATSGSLTFAVPATAGTNTITWPAATTDFSATGGTNHVLKQSSVGGAFTSGAVNFNELGGSATNSQMPTLPLNTQTGNYTLVLADLDAMVDMNCASGCNLTIPTNSSVAFPVGKTICFTQSGAGAVTIVGPGVTLLKTSTLIMGGVDSMACAYKYATDTWKVGGNLQ